MTDPILSRRELDFLLFDWLNVATDGDQRDTYAAVLDLAERLAIDHFLPHYKQADVEEPYLDSDGVHILPAIRVAVREYAAAGLFGAGFSPELGGFGLPQTITLALGGILASANVSTASYPGLTAANARVIVSFGNAAQVRQFALPQIEGRWCGTMCLSEPHVGSSLGDIRTRALPDGEDELGQRYRLIGNKMWITAGDQDISDNIVHLVLAKVAGDDGTLPEGSKGISLFIVPKFLPDGSRNDVAVAGLNHKMGYRGSSNCLLNFGENAGATGWIVGQQGQGLAQMFMMMNEARLGVGMGAAVLGYRGYRHAALYAQERVQGRPLGARGGPPVAINAHADVRKMLMQQKAYSEGAIALCLYCATLVDKGGEEAEQVLALLTPVAKTWSSEYGLMANDLAIQVHGGYGYTRDFDVEQLWRDSRINPIHEGTTGIQGIDLLGRKLLHADGRSYAALMLRIGETVAHARQWEKLSECGAGLEAYWEKIGELIQHLKQKEGVDAFNESTLFLRAFGHGVIAWIWLSQAICALSAEGGSAMDAKVIACQFFFENELPQGHAWMQIIAGSSSLLTRAPAEVFL